MPAIVHGIKSSPIPQTNMRFESDRYGVAMLTLVQEVPDAYFPNKFIANGTAHPRFRYMAVSRRSGERGKAGAFWYVSYLYEGYLDSIPEPTYELSGSLEQQPIQTHPDFAEIAGTATSPLNGSIFRPAADGGAPVWKEFGEGAGKKMGVDSYLDPGAIWTKTSFSLTVPNLRELGKIDRPDGTPPSMPGRNWLMWEVGYRRRGSIIELRESWKLSGRGGWDSDIY